MRAMTEINHQASPASEIPPSVTSNKIGGWLILPAINLVVAIVGLLILIGKTFVEGPIRLLVGAVLVATFAAFLYSVFCLIVFFQKRKITRILMIGFYGGTLLLGISLFIIFPDATASTRQNLIAFWIRTALELTFALYFVFSKRVKRTFVN